MTCRCENRPIEVGFLPLIGALIWPLLVAAGEAIIEGGLTALGFVAVEGLLKDRVKTPEDERDALADLGDLADTSRRVADVVALQRAAEANLEATARFELTRAASRFYSWAYAPGRLRLEREAGAVALRSRYEELLSQAINRQVQAGAGDDALATGAGVASTPGTVTRSATGGALASVAGPLALVAAAGVAWWAFAKHGGRRG